MRNRASKVSKIEPIRKGPFVHVRKGNEIIHALNALLAARGGSGVKVVKAEAGFVIEFDAKTAKGLPAGGEGGGTGSLNWKGVWSSAQTYAEGDIVIRPSVANMGDLKAGTFVSKTASNLNNQPPSGETTENTHWATLARGHWVRMFLADPDVPEAGSFDALGGKVLIKLDNNDPPTQIDLGMVTAIPAELVGKTFRPTVHEICIGGVIKRIGVIATEPFDAP
jgi:hypothetical protein